MNAYIIRRLLLMIPTIFGVTIISFLIMQCAPGDPLQDQLSQVGAAGQSSVTRESYLLQRRQWGLDKPKLLNFRYFSDYSHTVTMCATFRGMTDGDIQLKLDSFAKLGESLDPKDRALLDFLRTLNIENFDGRLQDAKQREGLFKTVTIAVQIKIEEIEHYAVNDFARILRETKDVVLRRGAIRSMVLATFGDPFTYTYSKDPQPEETGPILSTWETWWKRVEKSFTPLTAERTQSVQNKFTLLATDPSRSHMIEALTAMAADGSMSKNDAPFLIEKLFRSNDIKDKYTASLALKSFFGKPLKYDVRTDDSESAVNEVTTNWLAYIDINRPKFDPSLMQKIGYILGDTQYAHMLTKLVTFSFGKSMLPPYDPVGTKILNAAIVSAPLMLFSQLLVYLIAVPLGLFCAVKRGKTADKMISLLLFILYSIPAYVAALLFLSFLCYGNFLKIFPTLGLHSDNYQTFTFMGQTFDYLWHIFLPVICMSIFSLAGLAMYSRTSMLDVINQDYIRTARAKGLPERIVILKHALRNSMIPIITLFANFIPALLGGSVIIEVLFGIPGMGRMSLESITSKDYNTLMALLFIDAIVVMLSILLADLLYVVIDPRISFQKSEAST